MPGAWPAANLCDTEALATTTIDWWQPIFRGLSRLLRPIFKGIARLISWTGQ
jgi:hypothetical protein